MKRLAALLTLFVPLVALADSFNRGEELRHSLSICTDKESALEILRADEHDGFEAAKKLWDAKDNCVTVPVVGPTVGRVVASAQIERDGKKLTVRVVEILDGDRVVAYFFTTLPVNERMPKTDPKTKRNS